MRKIKKIVQIKSLFSLFNKGRKRTISSLSSIMRLLCLTLTIIFVGFKLTSVQLPKLINQVNCVMLQLTK